MDVDGIKLGGADLTLAQVYLKIVGECLLNCCINKLSGRMNTFYCSCYDVHPELSEGSR